MKKMITKILFLLAAPTLLGETPFNFKMLEGEKTCPAILTLQKDMQISANPKILSKDPFAVCFQANIDSFLSIKASKKIFGCVFSDRIAMNAALLRAGLAVHTEIKMPSDAQVFDSQMMIAVGGHDFDGKELHRYEEQKVIPKQTDTQHQAQKDIEQLFHQRVLEPILKENKDFVFFAITNSKTFLENLSHELIHAQYYNDAKFASVLETTWQEKVSSEHKDIIVKSLRNGGYDMGQQDLLLREFYSYFLQENARSYLEKIVPLAPMAPLAEIYGKIIEADLNAHGLKVLRCRP